MCHLAIGKGEIEAKVSGSELYTVKIAIKTLSSKKWIDLKRHCTGKIGSLIELLQGKLSEQVMEVVTDRQQGLFPLPGEISLQCSCPDWASMCKHVAAVLYGAGARLDTKPELLFTLRGVDYEDLIAADAQAAVASATASGTSKRLDSDHLSDVFGIELAADPERSSQSKAPTKVKAAPRRMSAKIVKKPANVKRAAKPQAAPAVKKARRKQVA